MCRRLLFSVPCFLSGLSISLFLLSDLFNLKFPASQTIPRTIFLSALFSVSIFFLSFVENDGNNSPFSYLVPCCLTKLNHHTTPHQFNTYCSRRASSHSPRSPHPNEPPEISPPEIRIKKITHTKHPFVIYCIMEKLHPYKTRGFGAGFVNVRGIARFSTLVSTNSGTDDLFKCAVIAVIWSGKSVQPRQALNLVRANPKLR